MKKILILSMLFFSLGANAQIDTSHIKFIEPPDSTGIGTPDGKLVSKEIGPTGGTIVSEDGRVELIFPAGALATNTAISIQPTTNLAPNGSGKSYQFEPSGTQFKKPVEIIFHYNDEEAETCPPELMSFAMQNHAGKWSFINYDDWDSTARILKGFIHHFSGLSNIYNLKLEPAKNILLVGESTEIDVIDISRKLTTPQYGLDFELAVLGDNKTPLLWYVNGFENGNTSVGQIESFDAPLGSKKKLFGCGYHAPQYMLQDYAYIRLDVYVFSRKNKAYHKARSIRCKIVIYDIYKVKVEHTAEYRASMGNVVTDSSTFTVSLFPPKPAKGAVAIIDNIKKYTPIITQEGKGRAGCKLKIYPVEGSNSIYVSLLPNNYVLSEGSPPEVSFDFGKGHSMQLFFKFQCLGKVPTPVTPLYSVPINPEIKFIANGIPQIKRMYEYTIKVTPIRGDVPPPQL